MAATRLSASVSSGTTNGCTTSSINRRKSPSGPRASFRRSKRRCESSQSPKRIWVAISPVAVRKRWSSDGISSRGQTRFRKSIQSRRPWKGASRMTSVSTMSRLVPSRITGLPCSKESSQGRTPCYRHAIGRLRLTGWRQHGRAMYE